MAVPKYAVDGDDERELTTHIALYSPIVYAMPL